MRALTTLTVTAALSVALSGCAADPEPSPSGASASESTSPTPTDSPSPSPKEEPTPKETPEPGPELMVTLDGAQILPNAAEIDVAAGEPLTIRFMSDRPGQLHVHSKPDQVLDFPAGKSSQEVVIKTPGLVEIEEHETGKVVARVQVGG